jgi:uncharacterized protein
MSQSRRLTQLGALVFACAGLIGAGDGGPPLAATGPQEVNVVGLLVDDRSNQPTIVLQGKRDKRTFAMVIGPAEATGIALPLQNLTPPRPLTHDLFVTLFGRLQVTVTKAVITDLRNDTFFATLFLSASGSPLELDARPSDAIALALRAKAPFFAEDRVFDKAGLVPGGRQESGPRI